MTKEYYSCGLIESFSVNVVDQFGTNEKVIALCCEPIRDSPAVAFRETAEETIDSLIQMRAKLISESKKYALGVGPKKRSCTAGCAKCVNYQNHAWSSDGLIHYVNLSMYPAPCQSRCIYCTVDLGWDKSAADYYEKVFDTLEYAEERGLIAPDAIWQVSSGEITIHPYKKRIFELVKNHRAAFYTNCFIYDEDIAKNLGENPASFINLSIDSGTPETWQKIKGYDNFEDVTSNLVKYYVASARSGQITLKYILLPGINDTIEDYMSLVEIMKVIEVPHLTLSRDVHKKYSEQNAFEHEALIHAAAYLISICHKNHITIDLGTFSPLEREQALQLAKELLRQG